MIWWVKIYLYRTLLFSACIFLSVPESLSTLQQQTFLSRRLRRCLGVAALLQRRQAVEGAQVKSPFSQRHGTAAGIVCATPNRNGRNRRMKTMLVNSVLELDERAGGNRLNA